MFENQQLRATSMCKVVFVKDKSKVVPVHTMMAYKRSRDINPLIFNLGTRWGWVFILCEYF
jgi:hypothetical protein